MILLLDVDKEDVGYCLKDNDRTIEQGKEREIGLLKERLCRFNKDRRIKMVGYRVQNCPRDIDRSVMELTGPLATHIGEVPSLGSNSDIWIRELFNFCRECFRDSRHFILCDSAFFLNMPEYAKAYAIPFEYTQAGLVRCPRNGIAHEWAVKKLTAIKGLGPKKVITIFFDDGADVVAVKDGLPVGTSQGFSNFDGITSQTGCGSIDTSIIFRLFSAGYSLESIYQILSQESGFKALVGEKLGFADLIVRRNAKATKALDIFSYQLIKTIGAGVAVLEGVDSIVFIGEDRKDIQDWTYRFLRQTEFLGLKRHKNRTNKDTFLMTGNSPIEAYYFGFDKWEVMSQLLFKTLTAA